MPCRLCLSGLAAVALVAAAVSAGHSQTRIPASGTDRHRVQYADSTVSINDMCPGNVRHGTQPDGAAGQHRGWRGEWLRE